ncbi:MAG: DNA primase [Alphaproteobacteria bacterium]
MEELRSRVGLVATVGRRVRLVRAGTAHKGLCPFHNEKTPSFTVDERRGTFHCFGCGAHGNAIDFVMRTENLGFREAVERLAGEAGLPLPQESPADRAREERRTTHHEVLEAAAQWYVDRLADRRVGSDACAYLTRRGLDAAAIARFGLGFAPAGRTALKEAFAGRFPEALLVEAGLLVRPEGEGPTYDRFRGRVMFPIRDVRDRVVGFGGRVLGDGEPKYLNSPETELFQKGRLLYGLCWAGRPARAAGEIVAVEGYMDVIALHRAGIETAVAPLGTAMTEQQMALLWKHAPEPVLCFDGDTAGRRAASRAAERALPLLKPGFSLRFAMLPQGEDPDSLVRARGAEAMRAVLAEARALRDVLWEGETAGGRFDTPERRAGLRQRLRTVAARIEDRETQQEYQQEFARACDELFGRGRPAAGARLAFPTRPPFRNAAGGRPWSRGFAEVLPERVPRALPEAWNVHESRLLGQALRDGARLAEIAESLGSIVLRTPALEALRCDLVAALASERLDSGAIESHLTGLGHGPTLERLRSSEARRGWACVGAGPSPEEALLQWRHAQIVWQLEELERERALAGREFAEADPPATASRLARLAAEKEELLRHQAELAAERDVVRQARTGKL